MEETSLRSPVVLQRPDHPLSRKLIDPDALWIMQRLRREGYLAYLVGGAVRDLMLGREPKDFDIGTNARPSEVKRLFRNCRLIGRRFRLAHVYFRKKGEAEKIVEVSTFRSLRKIEEATTIPPEDPVRMLRALEFAVRLGFRIEEATAEGIRRHARRMEGASPARLREEIRQMQEKGIMGPVLADAHRRGLFEVLLPEVEVVEGMFPLLDLLDERASAGATPDEASYIAALVLPTVASRYPFVAGADLERAQEVIAAPVEALTAHYHISSHIRHLARELLLSCYRIARGRAYRTKGKFVRKPEFREAWTFFNTWARIAGGLDETVAYWNSYLQGPTRAVGSRPRRRRRRSKARGASTPHPEI